MKSSLLPLSICLLALAIFFHRPLPDVSADGTTAGATLQAVQVPGNQELLYLYDARAQRLCVYRYQKGAKGGALQFLAARRTTWDLKLEDFHTASPKPRTLQKQAKEAEKKKPQ